MPTSPLAKIFTNKSKAEALDRYTPGNLLLQTDYYDKERQKSTFRFATANYIDFFLALKNSPSEERHWYEIINTPLVKLYFDLEREYEIKDEIQATEDMEAVLQGVLHGLVEELGPTYSFAKNNLLLSAHGPGKRSYHIVVDGLTTTREDMRSLAQTIRDKYVPKNLWTYPLNGQKIKHTVDLGVYSTDRAFRMLGNTKRCQNRFLVVDPRTVYSPRDPGDPDDLPDDLKELRLFAASLITQTSHCQQLPPLEVPKPTTFHRRVGKSELADDSFDQALELLYQHPDLPTGDFKPGAISSNFLTMTRLRPGYCPVHKRDHGGKNSKGSDAFLSIFNGKAYFNCFRDDGSKKKGVYLGYVGPTMSIAETLNLQGEESESDDDVGGGLYFGEHFVPNPIKPTGEPIGPSTQVTGMILSGGDNPDQNVPIMDPTRVFDQTAQDDLYNNRLCAVSPDTQLPPNNGMKDNDLAILYGDLPLIEPTGAAVHIPQRRVPATPIVAGMILNEGGTPNQNVPMTVPTGAPVNLARRVPATPINNGMILNGGGDPEKNVPIMDPTGGILLSGQRS